MIGGLTLGYVELLRPGMILPGVCGAMLAMIGVASLAEKPVSAAGLAWAIGGYVLACADAWFGLRGVLAAIGALACAHGARNLVTPPIAWGWAAGLSLPFVLLSWWLLTIALRARANKLIS